MTLSILQAFARTYVLRSLPMLATGIAFVVGGPLALYGLFRLDGLELDPQALDPFGFQITYLFVGGFLLCIGAYVGHEGQRRQAYVLPVSTRALGTWQMASSAATIAAANVLALLLLRRWLGAEWPVLGTTLFLATVAVVGHAVHWNLCDFRWWKALVAGAVGIAGVFWIQTRLPGAGHSGNRLTWEFSAEDGLVLAITAAAAWVLGLRALERDRHGRGRTDRSLDVLIATSDDRLLGRVTGGEVAATTPERALAWMLWARTLLIGWVGAAIFTLPFLLQGFVPVWMEEPVLLEKMLSAMLITVVPCGFLLGMVASSGNIDLRNRGERISAHVGAMPVSDRTLGRLLVANSLWATLLVTTLLVLAMLVPLGVSMNWFGAGSAVESMGDHPLFPRFGYGLIPILIGLGYVLCWTLTGVSASLVLNGRPKLVAVVFVAGVSLFVSTAVVLRFVLPESVRDEATRGVFAAIAVAAVGLTLFAYVQAARRALIGSLAIVAGVAGWGAAGAFAWSLPAPSGVRLFAAAMASLIVYPLAAMPLAIRRNRHR